MLNIAVMRVSGHMVLLLMFDREDYVKQLDLRTGWQKQKRTRQPLPGALFCHPSGGQ
jgi:hypothetical protein